MAKIENKIAYPLVKPQPNDYVVLTDVSDDNETKTCLVGDIMGFYPYEIFSTTLSADQVKNAEGNPVILIPAKGPGTMIVPEFYEAVFSVVSDDNDTLHKVSAILCLILKMWCCQLLSL